MPGFLVYTVCLKYPYNIVHIVACISIQYFVQFCKRTWGSRVFCASTFRRPGASDPWRTPSAASGKRPCVAQQAGCRSRRGYCDALVMTTTIMTIVMMMVMVMMMTTMVMVVVMVVVMVMVMVMVMMTLLAFLLLITRATLACDCVYPCCYLYELL